MELGCLGTKIRKTIRPKIISHNSHFKEFQLSDEENVEKVSVESFHVVEFWRGRARMFQILCESLDLKGFP